MMDTIMIIDDDVELAENIATVLEGGEKRVIIRDGVEGAIAALVEHQPDLLILDVMFPENPSGGFDLAREIRHTPEIRDLPVILLTGVNQEFPTDFSSDDIDEDWIPVQELLEKPVDFSALQEKVQELLGA